MKIKFLLGFVLIAVYSCGQNSAKRKVDPEVTRLSNNITTLVRYLDNPDSCRKALLYLDSATAIDSNCFLCYYNKLMFLVRLKQYEKAIEVNTNLLRLAPNAHDLYLQGGMFYEKIGNLTTSKAYFQKSLILCNKVLDTLNSKNTLDYSMYVTNKAMALIMLNQQVEGNKVLKQFYDSLPDSADFPNFPKKELLPFMNKSKDQLLDRFFNSEKYNL